MNDLLMMAARGSRNFSCFKNIYINHKDDCT